jgi:hypothetical protein
VLFAHNVPCTTSYPKVVQEVRLSILIPKLLICILRGTYLNLKAISYDVTCHTRFQICSLINLISSASSKIMLQFYSFSNHEVIYIYIYIYIYISLYHASTAHFRP